MKRFIVLILLTALIVQSTSTLWIFVSFYLNQDYISKNVCINRFDLIPVCEGQCYLKDQLKNKEQQEQKNPELKLKETQLYFCHWLSFEFSLPEPHSERSAIRVGPEHYSYKFACIVFQPPRIS